MLMSIFEVACICACAAIADVKQYKYTQGIIAKKPSFSFAFFRIHQRLDDLMQIKKKTNHLN